MQKMYFFWLFLWIPYGFAQTNSEKMHLEGIYNGKNLFLQNPMYKTYGTFCVDELRLNGQVLLREPKSSAVEIKLSHLALRTAVDIQILHKSNCLPKILNPEVIRRTGYTTFLYFYAQDNKLYWRTQGEESDAYYVLEQFDGDAWTAEANITRADSATYAYTPTSLLAGTNKFRIKYVSSRFSRYSTDVEILLKEKIITFSPRVVKDRMTLSEYTYFEILNSKQKVILKGEAKKIPLRKLRPGDYFIVLDGEVYPFIKR